jgi:hypothetical protein
MHRARTEFIVTATGDEGALLLFMVPRAAPGLQVNAYETLDGRLAANLRLEHVGVSEAQRLAGAVDAAALWHGRARPCPLPPCVLRR